MPQYTLKLSFDIRQVTQSLAYEFVLDSPENEEIYPLEDKGPLAGTFNFQENDQIFIEVIASVPETTSSQMFESVFAVSNCTFVSVPARMTEFLSLFDQASACTTINQKGDWSGVTPIAPTPENEFRRFSIRSMNPLSVATKNGQWQISGYLSVQLPPLGKVPSPGGVRHQLYYFDPEGSSGNGGGFGP